MKLASCSPFSTGQRSLEAPQCTKRLVSLSAISFNKRREVWQCLLIAFGNSGGAVAEPHKPK